MASGYLSKTAFLKLEQCDKAYYFYRHFYHLRDRPGVDTRITFQRGHHVGFLARELFPGGIDVSAGNTKEQAIKLTQKLISEKFPVLYEATLVYENTLIMADILVYNQNGYDLYEVKSSVKISEIYLKDACMQYYVAKNIIPIRDIFLLTINSEYVLGDEPNIQAYFKRNNISKIAEKNYRYIQERLLHASMLDEKGAIPEKDIGLHCFSPYTCDFFETCWKNKIGERSIFLLGKTSRQEMFEWYREGITEIQEVPLKKTLPKHIAVQVEAFKHNKTVVNQTAMQSFIHNIKLPCAAIDMEVWGPSFPQIKGTRPFQKIPFLFSLVSREEQTSFFFAYDTDDRINFATALIESTKSFSSLLVYDKSLELQVINELINEFPNLVSELSNVANKLVDISIPVQQDNYYQPDFRGNYSLKAVSEAVLNKNIFENQNISTGLEAMQAFEQFKNEDNEIEKQFIKENLMSYCLTDSLAVWALYTKWANDY